MITCPTFTATIYVGLYERIDELNFRSHLPQEVERICQEYCDAIGLCVTITRTHFIYTGGNEPGCAVGLIKYPKLDMECTLGNLKDRALMLAGKLIRQLKQTACTVVFTDQTFYITKEDTDNWENQGWVKL